MTFLSKKILVIAIVSKVVFGHTFPSCFPSIHNANYQEKGTVVRLGDLPVYYVGNNSKAIIFNYDIFGFSGGRTRQLCDWLAEMGFLVILPDYFRGTFTKCLTDQFIKKHGQWSKLKVDWEKKVKPFAKSLGAESIGAIGTCWGSYMVVRLSADRVVKAGVSLHPTHPIMMKALGEDEEGILKKITGYQMMMPSKIEPPSVKKGGLAEKVLGGRIKILEFPEMEHGWTTQGDMEDPTVRRDINRAMSRAVDFFKKHLTNVKINVTRADIVPAPANSSEYGTGRRGYDGYGGYGGYGGNSGYGGYGGYGERYGIYGGGYGGNYGGRYGGSYDGGYGGSYDGGYGGSYDGGYGGK